MGIRVLDKIGVQVGKWLGGDVWKMETRDRESCRHWMLQAQT